MTGKHNLFGETCGVCELPTDDLTGYLSNNNTGYDDKIVCNCDACEFCGYIHTGECNEEDFKDIRISPNINEYKPNVKVNEAWKEKVVVEARPHPVEKCTCSACEYVKSHECICNDNESCSVCIDNPLPAFCIHCLEPSHKGFCVNPDEPKCPACGGQHTGFCTNTALPNEERQAIIKNAQGFSYSGCTNGVPNTETISTYDAILKLLKHEVDDIKFNLDTDKQIADVKAVLRTLELLR